MNLPAQPVFGMGPFGMIPVGALPVGAVTAFAGVLGPPVPATATPTDSTPTASQYVTSPVEAWGWMLCDGRALEVANYPELFAVLGYLYGGSDNSFNIPDYRGTFLRGTDYGANIDPDIAVRNSADGGSAASAGVGSRQRSAMLVHQHDYLNVPTAVTPSSSGSTASGAPSKMMTSTPVDANDALMTNTTGISQKETRPANTYVNYLIKFTYGPWAMAEWPR